MCTFVVLRGVVPQLPLVVAANRDEFYDRATAGPAVVETRPLVVAGRDLEQGGSWLGAGAGGLFVGLTNQRTFTPPDRGLRSRGEVVLEALRRKTLEGVRRYVASVEPRRYNPFNLIYGDATAVEVAYARTESSALEVESLPEGVTVLANDRLGSPHFPKTRRAAELVSRIRATSWAGWAEGLQRVLADHELPGEGELPEPPAHSVYSAELLRQLGALCIHTPAYGTRSATLLAITAGQVAHYLFVDGPPCGAKREDRTHLLSPAAPS